MNLEELSRAVVAGDIDAAEKLTKEAIADHIPVAEILGRGLVPGLRQVGELFEEHPPWENCCVIHDRAYHNAGGTDSAEESYDARLAADDALHACVAAHGDLYADEYADRYDMEPDQIRSIHAITADAMYGAVRFGGGPCSGLPWRWGFGYPGCSVLK